MITARYTYNRRVAKAPSQMELYFADKVLGRLAQSVKQLIPSKLHKEYKVSVFDSPGERGVWMTLPFDAGYIAAETGYGVDDDGIVLMLTDDGVEERIKLTGNPMKDFNEIDDAFMRLHDKFEDRLAAPREEKLRRHFGP